MRTPLVLRGGQLLTTELFELFEQFKLDLPFLRHQGGDLSSPETGS